MTSFRFRVAAQLDPLQSMCFFVTRTSRSLPVLIGLWCLGVTGVDAEQFQVNTYTTGEQWKSDVAAADDGRFVVIWESLGSSGTDTSASSIQGRLYSANGLAQGGEFQVNAYTPGAQQSPAVTMADDGRFAVVWVGPNPNERGSGTMVLGRVYSSDGEVAGGEIQISTDTAQNPADPVVRFAPNGDFLVAWSAARGAGRTIQAQLLRADDDLNGVPLGSELKISQDDNDTSESRKPAIRFLDSTSNSNSVVAWECSGCGSPDSRGIRGRILKADGSPETEPFAINAEVAGIQTEPSIAVKTDGDEFFVAWSTGETVPKIWGRQFSAEGGPLGDDVLLAGAPARYPAIGPLGDGFALHWWNITSGGAASPDIKGRSFAMDGTPKGQAFQVNTYTQGTELYSALATTGAGCSVATWSSRGSPGSDHDESSVQARIVGLDVELTIDDGRESIPHYETELTYTVDIRTSEPAIPDARLEVELPDELGGCSWTSSVLEGDVSGNTVSGNTVSGNTQRSGPFVQILDLPANSHLQYELTCAIVDHAAGPITAQAVLSDSRCSTSAFDNTILESYSDLQVVLTDEISQGEKICGDNDDEASYDFELKVSNTGNERAFGEVEDDFPEGLECSWTSSAIGGATGNTDSEERIGRLFQTLDMHPGSEVTYSISCGFVGSTGGSFFKNIATVENLFGVDFDTENNMATRTIELAADLEVILHQLPTTGIPGERAGYAFTVALLSRGPADVESARLQFTLPDDLVCWIDGLATAGASGEMDDCGTSVDHPCDRPDLDQILHLPSGGTVTYAYECTIDEEATGERNHSAQLTIESQEHECKPDDNIATGSTLLTPEAELDVEILNHPIAAVPGQSMPEPYIFRVENNGHSFAPIEFKDDFSEWLDCFWTSDAEGGASGNSTRPSDPGPVDPGPHDLHDDLRLPPGSAVQYEVTCEIDAQATGTIVNTAEAECPDGLNCSEGTNSDSVETSLNPIADLSITNSNGVSAAAEGQTLTYQIEVTNGGPSSVFGAEVEDVFPTILDCIWCRDLEGDGCATEGVQAGNIVDFIDLAVGASVMYTAVCTVDETFDEDLVNTATVTVPSGVDDPNLGNNSATDTDGPPVQFPFTERYSSDGTFDPAWRLLGHAQLNEGRLRLTEAEAGQHGSAILNAPFPSRLNVSVVFDYVIGSGSGGHGLSIFFFDGTQEPELSGGGPCLGYVSGSACDGEGALGGAYLGVGFDVPGEFSGSGSGGGGPNQVVVRGRGADDYPLLTRITLPEGIEGSRTIRLYLADQKLTVEVDSSGEPQTLIHQLDLTEMLGSTGASLPQTLKVGFAATTGDSSETNQHEIDNLVMTLPEVALEQGFWTSHGSMASARPSPTLTLLQDGRVLAVDGTGGTETEIYDPATGVWTAAGSLISPLLDDDSEPDLHSTTLLPSGKVLALGSGTAQIYDPATDSWSEIPQPEDLGAFHSATLLPSGEVLALGSSSEQIYQPATGTENGTGRENGHWLSVPTPASHQIRTSHTATLLPSGKVLVAGGYDAVEDSAAIQKVETFDRDELANVDEVWSELTDLHEPRARHTATLAMDGSVWVLGGEAENILKASPERIDPESSQPPTIPTSSQEHPRTESRAALLPSGHILVAGGFNNPDPQVGVASDLAQVYDPIHDVWQTHAMEFSRAGHGMVLMPSGGVLVSGGRLDAAGGSLVSSEVFWPGNGRWTTEASFSPAEQGRRHGHTATLLPTGKLLVVGGQGPTDDELNAFRSAELYDPSADAWTPLDVEGARRSGHTATVLPAVDGQVLILGGDSGDEILASTIFIHADGSWSPGAHLTAARRHHTATLLADGRVLVVGGEGAGELVAEASIYDPSSGEWTGAGELQVPRIGHTATLLPSGRVLVVGGEDATGQVIERSEIYDPASAEAWAFAPTPGDPRTRHTATALPSGQILVAGGRLQGGEPSAGAEIFDPETESWRQSGSLAAGRYRHTATLLTSGRVLVTGGQLDSVAAPQSSEIYDPASEAWSPAGELPYLTLFGHTATLLASGEVLLISLSGQRYSPDGIPAERRRPVISSIPGTSLRYDQSFDISGTDFAGIGELSDGPVGSPVAYPLIQLHSLENDRQSWLVPHPRENFRPDVQENQSMTLTVGNPGGSLPAYYDLPPIFDPGWHRLTVVTAGVPSRSELVYFECSLEVDEARIDAIYDPADVLIYSYGDGDEAPPVPVGGRVRFAIETRGGRAIQWQKNIGDPDAEIWVDIDGATSSTYLTPALSGLESGTRYRAHVSSGCQSVFSSEIHFDIEDLDAPTARVISPNGGEYWALSSSENQTVELVTFEVDDPTTWPCRVEIYLQYSNNEGVDWLTVPPEDAGQNVDGKLPRILGEGGRCPRSRDVESGTVSYVLPVEPPSGVPGSLYRIQIVVSDHAGNVASAESRYPFYIVPPNDDSIQTLILAYPGRQGVECDPTADDLCRKLRELADHPQVNGLVIDLGADSDIEELYAAWEGSSSNLDANRVLFDDNGIQDKLLELTRIYSQVRSVMLIGGDDVIPFARVPDRSGLLRESAYTDGADPDLSADGSAVGRAISADLFLTDDPLVTLLDPLDTDELNQEGLVTIPDVAVGRLVDSPDDIVAAISRFQESNGLLDLGERSKKVLVTGYDFLSDSARIVAEKWRCSYHHAEGDPPADPSECHPAEGAVNEDLISQGFIGDDLLNALCGKGEDGQDGDPYGLINLNGHANHHLEGVPGDSHYDIEGLSTETLMSGDACGEQPLDLQGAVVYAVGCHGGLPVPDDAMDDHRLDLPQVMLRAGALAYIANTGYGWGLKEGVGYSERLIEIFTDQLRAGETVSIGQAVLDAKLRYFQEARGLDSYGIKTLMQWSVFGFPMARVRIGLPEQPESTGPSELLRPISGPSPSASELEDVEDTGPLTVQRRLTGQGTEDPGDNLPPYLTRAQIGFELSMDSYVKRQADGTRVPVSEQGCPSEEGCYYTLNGLGERGTGDADRPIQPFFVYDSRLAGTSQHGVLWLGGQYRQESDWTPIFAQLISNAEDFGENNGYAPITMIADPIDTPLRRTAIDESCRVSDTELNTVVVPTGELLQDPDVSGAGPVDPVNYTIERIYESLSIEVLYFNNFDQTTQNCDREGPAGLERDGGPFEGEYHQADGVTIDWRVPVEDPSGVWRVVVVYNAPSSDSHGSWVPLELSYDSEVEAWVGSESFTSQVEAVTYIIQAVDERGNVSWLRFLQENLPGAGSLDPTVATDSGIDPRYPEVVPVVIGGTADLLASIVVEPNSALPGEHLELTVTIDHLGDDPAVEPLVSLTPFPGSTSLALALDSEWVCALEQGETRCRLSGLAAHASSTLTFSLDAPTELGTTQAVVRVESAVDDPNPADNLQAVDLTVVEVDLPPRVSALTSAAAVPGGLYSSEATGTEQPGGKRVRAALTQLRVSFDEPVYGADHAGPFLLVEAGPDGVWQTDSVIDGPLGDDLQIPFYEVTYEELTKTTVLGLLDARPLPVGRYRLLVGHGIWDHSEQFLDGDGDGQAGGDFWSDWRIVRGHRLLNPNFDRSTGDWIPEMDPQVWFEHSLLDSQNVPSSGSARFVSTKEGGLALAQCLAVAPGEGLAIGGQIWRNPSDAWTYLRISGEVWSSSSCGETLLSQFETEALEVGGIDEETSWKRLPVQWIDVPEHGRSLLITLLVGSTSSDSAELRIDTMEVYPMLFGDGFESRNTVAWSWSIGEAP